MSESTQAVSLETHSAGVEVREAFWFTWHLAVSCAFAGFIFLALGLTHAYGVPGLPRYDFLLVLCLVFQVLMVVSGTETLDELKVICVFHLLGLSMELLKVHYGSWSYPGAAYTKVGDVPLFSGFMYASVASFMCQAWRRLHLRFVGWPERRIAMAIGAAIYLNFMTNLFIPDLRVFLAALVLFTFRGAHIEYTPDAVTRRMPALVAFALIGVFVFFAENLGTFLKAWQYPNQHHGWNPVYWQKLSSWMLLVIVSLLIVTELKRLKQRREGRTAERGIS